MVIDFSRMGPGVGGRAYKYMFNYLGGGYKMCKMMKNNNLKIFFSSFWSVVKTSFDVCLAELWHLKIIHK